MSFAQFMSHSISPMRLPFNRQIGYAMYHNRDMSTFASRVRSRRKELELSQAELAKRSKLSKTTISDIERGRNDASREIVELAVALQCAPERLKTGQGPMEGITQVRSSVIHLGPSAVPVPRPSGQPAPAGFFVLARGRERRCVDFFCQEHLRLLTTCSTHVEIPTKPPSCPGQPRMTKGLKFPVYRW